MHQNELMEELDQQQNFSNFISIKDAIPVTTFKNYNMEYFSVK